LRKDASEEKNISQTLAQDHGAEKLLLSGKATVNRSSRPFPSISRRFRRPGIFPRQYRAFFTPQVHLQMGLRKQAGHHIFDPNQSNTSSYVLPSDAC